MAEHFLSTTNIPLIMSSYQFSPIGYVHSPYKEKFAIPRQPGLVSAAQGTIELINDFNQQELTRGLADFSHIWVLFVFHQTAEQGWKPLIRPPRLGGNKKIGVLASRSTFRPNPIGMSVLSLDDIRVTNKQCLLHVSGLDLLEGTPVLDIKPYVPYSDSVPQANASYATHAPNETISVSISESVNEFLLNVNSRYPKLSSLIIQVLEQDPRPAYKQQQVDDKIYGIRLYEFNIKWRLISARKIQVFDITYHDNATR
ncbi:tRNA (N6-threonylcarbamoyladenosine(37)-N6)-methyltransferase TrmO [Thalassotalea sp. 1_MG-2023]|uniref:tRNA (N6-threonylcarbamoyladenosine(37)-N6)-methyltransferase TrmO n=1 Tax=Thalassotalea sp. 1_MG-2023 TaxID=3062680 RepID=UPI0026E31B97|nr:tRNA (N6-threonylcarbamoyladenosine(37)-N6)-methyltransferase TrmO [Thalassotalea sp. 1_MG-2023]MDO6428224.1 tRNA (N6-threonylcarbamoyladenosine(37)-N6)-methyltransferase TrmO [Thalassotalea sp. 1_MG-2023]